MLSTLLKANRGLRGRAASPALSDKSDRQALLRPSTPDWDDDGEDDVFHMSPVKGQPDTHALGMSNAPMSFMIPLGPLSNYATPGGLAVESSDKNKNTGGRSRYVRARGHSPSPDRSVKKPRKFALKIPIPDEAGIKSQDMAKLGDLGILPIEVRNMIYADVLDVDNPVTIKTCCTPGKTLREVSKCRKHGSKVEPGTGRFNMLYVCQGLRQEVMKILFTKGSMILYTDAFMDLYLKGCPRSNSPRRINNFMQRDVQVAAMWNTIAQFRSITMEVSPMQVTTGRPQIFTSRLLAITSLLCNENTDPEEMTKQVRTVDIGGIFVHKSPFNIREEEVYDHVLLFDWLFGDYPPGCPEVNKLAAEVTHNLHRMVARIGKYSRSASWTIFVDKKLRDNEEGGKLALEYFEAACEANGVALVHAD